MAQSRTLWDAIDRDSRRWIRAAIVSVMSVIVVGGLITFLVMGSDEPVLQTIIYATAFVATGVFVLWLQRRRKARALAAIGAVRVPAGVARETKGALFDVTLAAGLGKPPRLLMYPSDATNAYTTRDGAQLCIAVSSAFVELPRAEQRAGIAMLIGRHRGDSPVFLAERQLNQSGREDPPPPDRDPVLFAAWLDAAFAGDREALRILHEPVPMIELLDRLSVVSTEVPEFAYLEGHDAVFGCLAWPYVDSSKVFAQQVSEHGEGMPPAAAAAVFALIAEEKLMSRRSGLAGTASFTSISGAEALRAQRLREVTGAEGAVAGLSSAARRRASGTSEPREVVPESTATPAPPVPTPVAVPVAASGAAAAASAVHSGRPPHISALCPSCRASNAPANRTCIACGKRMAKSD